MLVPQLDPGATVFRFHGFCLCAFSGVEGAAPPASPGSTLWVQRVCWPSDLTPGDARQKQAQRCLAKVRLWASTTAWSCVLTNNEKNELYEISEKSLDSRRGLCSLFSFLSSSNVHDAHCRVSLLTEKEKNEVNEITVSICPPFFRQIRYFHFFRLLCLFRAY